MSKENIIESLKKLVAEWLDATGGNLEDVKANVELLLNDVATALNIEPSEIGL